MKNIILTAIIIIGSTLKVSACDCKPMKTVDESYSSSSSVLTGLVIKKELVSFSKSGIVNITDLNHWEGVKMNKYTIVISEVFKGLFTSDTINVYTGLDNGDCGFQFDLNKKYIIYGIISVYRKVNIEDYENSVWTSMCLRTRLIDLDEVETLKSL